MTPFKVPLAVKSFTFLLNRVVLFVMKLMSYRKTSGASFLNILFVLHGEMWLGLLLVLFKLKLVYVFYLSVELESSRQGIVTSLVQGEVVDFVGAHKIVALPEFLCSIFPHQT